MNEGENVVKCVLVGDASVGKTCMILSYATDKFKTEYIPTVFDNYTVTVPVDKTAVDKRNLTLSLWDTAGNPEYNKLKSLSEPQSDIFLVCFSVVDIPSFEKGLQKYVELAETYPNIPKIIVGTKIDLRNENIKTEGRPKFVGLKTAQKLFFDLNCKYMECSALTQDGLKDIFDEAIKIVSRKKETPLTFQQQNKHLFCDIF